MKQPHGSDEWFAGTVSRYPTLTRADLFANCCLEMLIDVHRSSECPCRVGKWKVDDVLLGSALAALAKVTARLVFLWLSGTTVGRFCPKLHNNFRLTSGRSREVITAGHPNVRAEYACLSLNTGPPNTYVTPWIPRLLESHASWWPLTSGTFLTRHAVPNLGSYLQTPSYIRRWVYFGRAQLYSRTPPRWPSANHGDV